MSLSSKTKKWLAAHCLPSLAGKTVLITGATSGVGSKTAETMVYLGASVILACRNPRKASETQASLLGEYPGADISVMELDLADFSSIDRFVRQLRDLAADVDVFLNNAAAFHHPGQRTADGLELILGTNYIGVYYLSEHVLPYLSGLGHEVFFINTVSIVCRIADVDYEDFYCAEKYRSLRVYARSKLCLARYSSALAERYRGTRVHVLMNHPGIAVTPLGLDAVGLSVTQPLVRLAQPLFNSPEKSSLSLAYIMSHEVPDGSVIGPTRLLGGWGYPRQNRVLRKITEGTEQLIQFTDGELARMSRL